MSNKVSLYTTLNITGVDFLFLNSQSELEATVAGVQNVDGVWEGTVPGNLPVGAYTVIGKNNDLILGHEYKIWNGSSVEPPIESLIQELYLLMGLDPSNPLVVNQTSRTVGSSINQSINNDGSTTTVTRL